MYDYGKLQNDPVIEDFKQQILKSIFEGQDKK